MSAVPPKSKNLKDEPEIVSGKNRRNLTFAGGIRRLGWPIMEAIYNIGVGARFSLIVVARSGLVLRRPSLLLKHLYEMGPQTLIIILIAGLFIGFVLGLQFYVLLERYGQKAAIGTGVALTLFRELGPVTAALLFVGCSCTAMTAAIGLKKASEQIAAMEIMAVDPIMRELSPRLWAAIIALPLLTIYFDVVGVIGSYIIAVWQIGVDDGVFWAGMKENVRFYNDFLLGVSKSVFFGFFAALIALYEGYTCVPTAEGVSRATTRTVIKGSLTVLGLDFILTAFMVN